MKKSREQNLKIIEDIQAGEKTFSDLTGSRLAENAIVVQDDDATPLSEKEIQEHIDGTLEKYPDNRFLPIPIIIIRDDEVY